MSENPKGENLELHHLLVAIEKIGGQKLEECKGETVEKRVQAAIRNLHPQLNSIIVGNTLESRTHQGHSQNKQNRCEVLGLL